MTVQEAKDFLVAQVVQQAALEGLALSDLEKRMMYFTESDDSCEGPIALNEEFESQYETAKYEPKISRLLHRAYKRVKDESPQSARQWNEAIRELKKGDHYLLVLWAVASDRATLGVRPPYDQLKLFAPAILLAIGLVAFFMLLNHFGIQFGSRGSKRAADGLQTPMPIWLQRLCIVFFAAAYLYFGILPLLTKRSPSGLTWLVSKFSRGAENTARRRH